MSLRFAAPVLCLLLAALAPSTVQAAQSYDGCAGFIDSLPAVISTQGTWCLRKDLNSAQSFGAFITVQANNVTVDCNDFKVGGLAGGTATSADGIRSEDRSNITVRNCNIRGFYRGVALEGDGEGHLVENNRFNGNTFIGVFVQGQALTVRGNQIVNTGGTPFSPEAYGIRAHGDVEVFDNTIATVLPSTNGGGSGMGVGISVLYSSGGSIRGNRVRRVFGIGQTGYSHAIMVGLSDDLVLRENEIVGSGRPLSIGINCGIDNVVARDNVITNYPTALQDCTSVDNTVTPFH